MRLHVEKKLSPKVHLWRKNDKYEVCLVMIPNKQQFETWLLWAMVWSSLAKRLLTLSLVILWFLLIFVCSFKIWAGHYALFALKKWTSHYQFSSEYLTNSKNARDTDGGHRYKWRAQIQDRLKEIPDENSPRFTIL